MRAAPDAWSMRRSQYEKASDGCLFSTGAPQPGSRLRSACWSAGSVYYWYRPQAERFKRNRILAAGPPVVHLPASELAPLTSVLSRAALGRAYTSAVDGRRCSRRRRPGRCRRASGTERRDALSFICEQEPRGTAAVLTSPSSGRCRPGRGVRPCTDRPDPDSSHRAGTGK